MNATLITLTVSILSLVIDRDAKHDSMCRRSEWLNSYHYIVVGSGSAGAIVATRLSEDPAVNVLLLEAGGPADTQTDLPGFYLTWVGSQFDWNYRTEPQKHMGFAYVERRQTEPRGHVLGGSSTINTFIYNRGNRHDYDKWAQVYGAQGWAYDQVLPYFKLSENNTDPVIVGQNAGSHGTRGPISVKTYKNLSKQLRAYQTALNGMGLNTIDINGEGQLGTSLMQFTINPVNMRSSPLTAYLMPNANRRPNLHILCRARALRVLFAGKKAIGIKFMYQGEKHDVFANFEVILSAGVIGSPQLLLLSGVGPKAHLKSLDIPCIQDLPVGEHLKDHVVVPHYLHLVNDTQPGIPPEWTAKNVLDFYANKTGPLTEPPGILTYYSTDGNDNPEYPDTCIYAWVMSYLHDLDKLVEPYEPAIRPQWKQYYRQFVGKQYFYAPVSVVRVTSEGRVQLKSKDPFEHPIINLQYLSTQHDHDALVKVVKYLYYIVEKTPFSKYVKLPSAIPGCKYCTQGPLYECDQYIHCLIRQIGIRDYHLGGSCRMGSVDRKDVVVDERLRVKGLKSIRVIDSSIMSDLINSNTQTVSMMIGEKGSHMLKQDNK